MAHTWSGQGAVSPNSSFYTVSFWRTNIPKIENKFNLINGLLPTLDTSKEYDLTITWANPDKQLPQLDFYKTSTWNSLNFDTERVWVINEYKALPRLIAKPSIVELGTPYTHQMRYQRVFPSLDGTMNFMGITWKSLGSFYRFPDPPAPGTDGQVVEYEVGNLEHTIFAPEQNKNIFVKFFASGVRDVLGAGGFSQYNTELKRSVTVGGQASAQVNFYFAEPKYLPSVNYKISISTPDGVVDIIGKGDSTGYPIRMQYDGIVLGIPTVSINDIFATNIHVMTDDGIQAFQEYSDFSFSDDIY